MAGMTNRGKKLLFDYYFRRQGSLPTKFYIALVTSATAPTPDTNLLSDLTQIAVGNGYADGGYEISPNTTDFDMMIEDDSNDKSILMIKDIIWTASGGALPASGNGARYAVLTTDEGTIANRQVIAYWDLSLDRSVNSGVQLQLKDLEIDLTE
ncbi:MAG: hypothetical protein DCC56_02890 [Anaerolineae bacterium]|nr:MAG: hypothetical protein DCC56_02890 [Anaerolineae bacterium]WKZ44216.1 MAG: hypothetical protein QY302_00325 [Anaerolineales bacterium]